MPVHKRPLPPTPNQPRFKESRPEYENEIERLKRELKDWKDQAEESERRYKESKQKYIEKERRMIQRHQTELDAITRAQVKQTNEYLDLISQLRNENTTPRLGATGLLCATTEMAYKTATTLDTESQSYSDRLIDKMNEMMHQMEGTLSDFHQQIYAEEMSPRSPPPLSIDIGSSEEEK
ncbi:hypothetical protein BY458DRAFT_510996 [Sporodiniella umbellata]|nr:hypothetical protein BY458DRAFT_510996 [Sporodiniella umbellata]